MSVPSMSKNAATATADQARSATRAIPCPPPMQSEATPSRASRSAMAWRSVTSTRAPLAPMGWPSAMAPPCTLTRFLGMWSSRSTPSDWAANASFSSQRSISSRRSFTRSSAFSEAGHGPMPRIDARSRVGADGGQRRQPELLRLAVRHDDHRGAAVVDARGVAGGGRAVLLEGGLESREPLRGGVAARVLVGIEAKRLALLGGDLDRYDLRLELPALLRGGRLLLALGRELVLFVSADAIFAGDVLGGDAHVHEGDRAGEAVGDHRVEDLVVPQADAEAGLLQDVGRAAHAF